MVHGRSPHDAESAATGTDFYEVHLCPYQTMIYYLSSYITLSLACALSSIYVYNFPENVSTVIPQHIVGYSI